jgi:hypothetical protein
MKKVLKLPKRYIDPPTTIPNNWHHVGCYKDVAPWHHVGCYKDVTPWHHVGCYKDVAP